MKSRIVLIALFCGLIMSAGLLSAQTHYPAGVEGIKGPSLPPPGVYIRDYNYMYFASKLEVERASPEFRSVRQYPGAPSDLDHSAESFGRILRHGYHRALCLSKPRCDRLQRQRFQPGRCFCGADYAVLARKAVRCIRWLWTLDPNGRFQGNGSDFAGQRIFDADAHRGRDVLSRQEQNLVDCRAESV